MKKDVNVLITGGCGFIGVNLIDFILEKTNWQVRVLDNLYSGKKEYLSRFNDDRLSFVKGDIRDERVVEEVVEGCDFVVNLAAQVGVMPSIKDPFFDMDINVKGALSLLNACVENNVSRFVQASSAAPLGEQDMPLDEEKVPRPLSPYGASKLACEGYCSAFSGSYGLKTVVLRFSNVYGPWSELKGSVIPLFIRQILNDETLTVYGDGCQTRDFVYVSDICQGIFLGLTEDLSEGFSLFQLGTGVETSVNQLIEILQNVFPDDFRYEYAPARDGEIIRNYADISKAEKRLGYKPRVSIEEGVKRTVGWFEKYRED